MPDPRTSLIATAVNAETPEVTGERPSLSGIRMLLYDPGACVGLGFILFIIAVAALAPFIAGHDPTEQSVVNALLPPSLEHWFGTDEFGRDVFSRAVYGARPALIVGLLSVGVSMAIGVPLGMLAGFKGGWLDTAVTAIVDTMLSFPAILMALFVVTLIGTSLPVLICAIGISSVPIYVRLARSSTLLVRELDYVAASRTFGASDFRIVMKHILPNIVSPLIVMATLSISGAITTEASLSFLGLGIQPPTPSWGNLIRDGVNAILEAPWLALIPGLCLTVSVLAFNIVGDTLRDLLDPRDLASSASEKGKK
ncbi:ABC transporter permease [Microvirga sp. VF16]|uniref:ABC transporter permease n=1 Tax=Microvirga sp. VF16 TaxID=2807101 RepID=UPI00193E2034|nr:ABC transporter permease [Microvirga sp. VF16]QRM32922.1 ABC transporter permease [Microvirga sp. VF16]